MAPHLSLDLKERLVAALTTGKTVPQCFGVSERRVRKVLANTKRPEGIGRKNESGGKNKIRTEEFKQALTDKIAANPK
ncbi:Hypothetical protein FKW44_004156, partial [Caligus rogercresseyi]